MPTDKDMIERAIEEQVNETEREGRGTIDGHDVTLLKRTYDVDQFGTTAWMIEVFIDGDDKIIGDEREKDLDAGEADARFEELCEKHNLVEKYEMI